MQEQNFEKQVQQTMEELSFVPSEPVWQKVESQIRGKKDRRRLIFWILPVILLGGGYFILSRTNDSSVQHGAATVHSITGDEKDKTVNNNISTNQINSTQQESDKSINENEENNVAVITALPEMKKNNAVGKERKVVVERRTNVSSREEEEINSSTEQESINRQVVISGKRNTEGDQVKTESTHEIEKAPDATVYSNKTNDHKDDIASITAKEETVVAKDSIASATQPAVSAEPILEKLDTVSKAADSSNVVKSIKLKNKWTVSFKAVIGVSTLSDKLNPFGSIVGAEEKSASNLYADRAPVQSASSNFNNAAVPTIITLPPSPVYKDFSYAVGVDVRKKIRNRLEFVTGLQYNYFSTWQYVGTRVDNSLASRNYLSTAVSPPNFYLNSAIVQSKYVTKYHFISIPIGLDYQLSKHKPLKLSLGITASQLLSTNALYYDKAAAVYYQKESLFGNTQLFGTTALTYRLINKKIFALDLGPQVQFGFTNLLAKKTDGQQHLVSAGLSTRFSF